MNLASLLPYDQVACDPEACSKKRVLEELSGLLAKADPTLSKTQIFQGLLSREQLGSTGLGKGVALPHTRINDLQSPSLALIKLKNGIDFDAPDHQPVDLLFALMVPEASSQVHLDILAQLAEMLRNPEFLERLRGSRNCQALHQLATRWQTPTHA